MGLNLRQQTSASYCCHDSLVIGKTSRMQERLGLGRVCVVYTVPSARSNSVPKITKLPIYHWSVVFMGDYSNTLL